VYHCIDRKSAIDNFLDSSNNRTLTPEEESWVREQTNELPLDLRQAYRHNSQLPDVLRLYSSGSTFIIDVLSLDKSLPGSEPFYDQITGSQLNERHQRLRAIIESIAAASPEDADSMADRLAGEILSETPGSIGST